MSQNTLRRVLPEPLRAAIIAVSMGAAIATSGAYAESTVTVDPVKVDRPVIEKTIGTGVVKSEPAPMMRSFSMMAAVEPMQRYIIALNDPSVALYRGGIDGYEATSTGGQSRLDVRATHVQAYQAYLATNQDKFLQEAERRLGRALSPVDQFQVASNAIVVELTDAEAQRLASIAGVRSIQKDQVFQLESVDVVDGYAIGATGADSNPWLAVVAFALVFLLLLSIVAWRKGWIGKRSAAFAAMAASLGMAGCYYEGGFQWIGAPQIWHGTAGTEPTRGEGIVVGILDTGINPISDSFAAIDGDGYQHTNPKGKFFGVCDPAEDVYDPTFPCNDKLIGAWGWPAINDGSARDMDGHGSHTAGTTAGNIVYNATVSAPTGFEVSKTIAGVSPRSNIIAYNVCGEDGCYLGAILFAINQAIIDGVDVINYSIGGGSRDPWADQNALAFLAAMDAGVFVATSAGNSGPGFGTMGSPADAPWITSVAASSHNLLYKNSVVGMVNDQGDTLPEMIGQSIAPGIAATAIVDAKEYGNPLCLEGQFNARFEGEIVLCELGVIARVAKGQNVLDNGGAAIIVARPPSTPDGSGYFEADAHVVPATQITYTDFLTIRTWLEQGTGHQAALTGTEMVIADEYADVVAYFSSRGVNPSVPSVVKPNITAPGRAIFAAFHEDYSEAEQDYNIIQGTSMSSPHIAGAGALLKALHPEWTPMQIQSAMMTTANLRHFKEDGVTQAEPFEMGGGRIDLPQAAKAALVLDETLDNFLAQDPFVGGSPSALNITALGDAACVVNCTWTRTVTNVSDRVTRWRSHDTAHVAVSPRQFRLLPGQSQELTFTADASDVAAGEWLFDQVHITALTRGVPSVHFPVAALSALSNIPGAIDITAANDVDSVRLEGLKAIEITNADVQVLGLAKATAFNDAVVSDPTNGDPFDGGFEGATSGQAVFFMDVPMGASRLVVEITEAASTDLDLWVGMGDTPGFDSLLSYAATGATLEYVNIENPPAGQIWIVVQNWQPGYAESQPFTVHAAAVAGNEFNLTVDMPIAQPAGEAFDAVLEFSLPGSEVGDRYYGSISFGTDPANAGNLGTTNVDLVRQ